MIDPDGIMVQDSNLPDIIKINNVPEFNFEVYNLDDDKDYNTFIKDVERQVRMSFEYREFIKFCRNNFGMNKCAFLNGINNEETFDIKIEIHHYPFSLHDIVEAVIKKRQFYNESLEVQMVAKEVMILHYKAVIGLIPLSETAHELAHSSRLFIPSDRVFGRYNLFVDYYKPFISDALLDTLERIEKYTIEKSDVQDTTILDQNTIEFEVNNKEYQLPDMSKVTDAMSNRIATLKSNNYMLPTKQEALMLESKSNARCPIMIMEEPVHIDLPDPSEIKFDYIYKK